MTAHALVLETSLLVRAMLCANSSEQEDEYGMNCHTYTSQEPRAVASAAVRTTSAAAEAPLTYALSDLVGPGHDSSTGKARKEESGSDESLKLHFDEGLS